MTASITDRLYRALTYPLLSAGATAAATVVAVVTFAVLVASSSPTGVARALSLDAGSAVAVVVALTVGTYEAAGPLGVALTVAYAALTGVATVVVVASVRTHGGGTANLLGVAPGVLAAGCASCGAGVLSVLGVAGAYALFPFAGNFVRAVGILVLLAALARTGDPRRCDWE